MARKVFISVLGTGYYGKCRYKKNDFVSAETRYIQQATLEMLSNSGAWTDKDKGIILLTDNARTANWQVAGNKRLNLRTSIEEEYPGLEESIKSLHLPFHVDDVAIPTGSNENEIWQIFDILFGMLQEGDELYFDITHGFRYLPMLVLVLGNYAKFLKGVMVRSITYGNYESADKTVFPPIAPIIDITSFSTLQDWTFSGASFVEQGRVRNFTDSVSLLLGKKSVTSKKDGEYIRRLNKVLNTFESQITTCRGNELLAGNSVCEAKELIGKVMDCSCMPEPLCNILETINAAILSFGKDTISNLSYSLIWCKRYKLIQQGYTLCQESIITHLCMQFQKLNPYKDEKKGIKKYRDYWSAILGMSDDDARNEGSWMGTVAQNRSLSRSLFNTGWIREVRKGYVRITQKRNQLNHAGFTGKVSSRDIINSFDKNIDWCVDFLNAPLILPDLETPIQHKVFINLSNHPSASWSKEQTDAAKEYGDILDIPFPQVAPDATEKDIEDISDALVDKILVYSRDNEVTAHVMGEMGLTYSLVKRLKKNGIHCVCSTSYRIVEDKGNGKRLVEFHFKKFRDYE